MRSIPLRSWLLVTLSAVLQLLPFPLAGPVPLWRRLLCWFCLVPLLHVLIGKDRAPSPWKPKQAASLGYLCGFLWYAGNCYWIYPTMHLYGALPAPAAVGILLLFSLYVGLYHALFAWLLSLLRLRSSGTLALLTAPFLWVAVELARARITGFPWDLLGYTQVDNLYLTRLAPWTGVMGLSLLVAVVNALWLLRIPPRDGLRGKNSAQAHWRFHAGPAAALALTLLGAFTLFRATEPVEPQTASARLLQENLSVGAEGRGAAESKQALLNDFTRLSFSPTYGISRGTPNLSSPPQVILWPESPAPFVDRDPEFRQTLGDVAKLAHAPVIVDSVGLGALSEATGRPKEYVSASFFLPDGSYAGRYDKMHLVPFGEYTPYKQLFFFAGHLLDGLNFVPGTERSLFAASGHHYGVFICYESIFGDEVREFARSGADVLVNLSDDGWYGDSSAPWEHLDMVRMRAIENRRWVLRSTNTGITATIDPFGRLTSTMPRHVRGSLEAGFGYRSETTFYTNHGDWIGWLCVGICVIARLLAWRRPAVRPQVPLRAN